MNGQTAFTVLGALLVLGACQTAPQVQPAAGGFAAPLERNNDVAKPYASNPECNTADTDKRLTKRCVVTVSVTWDDAKGCVYQDVPNVILKNGKKAIVIWDLPDNFLFCPALGDGVYLRQPSDVDDDAFDDFGTPDEGNGKSVFKKCRNRFRIFAENPQTGRLATKEYPYIMQFHFRDPKSGVFVGACKVDPFIKNG